MDGMSANRIMSYLLVDVATGATAPFADARLAAFTERHTFHLEGAQAFSGAHELAALQAPADAAGVVFMLDHGAPGRALLRTCKRFMREGRQVYFYWPSERAAELIDDERLKSYWQIWFVSRAYQRWRKFSDARRARKQQAVSAVAPAPGGQAADVSAIMGYVGHIAAEAESLRAHNRGGLASLEGLAAQASAHGAPDLRDQIMAAAAYFDAGLPALDRIEQQARTGVEMVAALSQTLAHTAAPAAPAPRPPEAPFSAEEALAEVRDLRAHAAPVPLKPAFPPSPARRLEGVGVYLRLDFWAPLTSGGSYGHTVYQAEALSRTTRDFVAIVSNPFKTLDDLGVRQVVLQPQRREGNETNIVDANRFYAERLRPMLQALKPVFVFERAVLGNYVGAKLCKELGIPYIVEYNGSEISMMRSFSGKGYEFEDFYLAAEDFTFNQATLASVVSEHVGADVARRGVPDERILLNPNAVHLGAYAPAAPAERAALRSELGFSAEDRVIGFIGTFGGWHGVDVLAAALPKILARAPGARFLLIGDGNLKPLVREAIDEHKLGDRVVDAGRVPQMEGARLLKACDVLVSPHSSHMVDSKFFGSPTKLFEYMAMAAGIVASDLEQIGEVLAPALTLADVRAGKQAGDARALLCKPGDVDEFVEAVLALVENPALSDKLGANARAAAERYYTWDQHVADLWAVLAGTARRGFHADLADKGHEKGRPKGDGA